MRQALVLPDAGRHPGSGKRARREALTPGQSHLHSVTLGSAGRKGGTISIKDNLSGQLFLIDSGADVSVLPLTSPSSAATGALVAANGTRIRTFGVKSVELQFGSLSLSHHFYLAEISLSLIHI